MNLIEELLNRRMILRKENRELYYQIKDHTKEIQKIVQDKLGYLLVVNQHLIKLEKIPGLAEPWMGIQEFSSSREYQMFCFVLMFLEDKSIEEQFVLSNLTEYIQSQFEGEIDWINYTTRRQFVRVLKYCVASNLLKNDGGEEDNFSKDSTSEVLYENTGISRYFLRHFSKDIHEYKKPQDFEQSEWIGLDEDRGFVRRQRVYRRLLLSPGVYRQERNDEDFIYLRNYRNQISHDFDTYFSSSLHLHKGSAYLVLSDTCSMGKVFPGNNGLHDLILIVMGELTKNIKKMKINFLNKEFVRIKNEDLYRICQKIIKVSTMYLPKKYQDTADKDLIELILNEMERLGFVHQDMQETVINPICGKLSGNYSGGSKNVY